MTALKLTFWPHANVTKGGTGFCLPLESIAGVVVAIIPKSLSTIGLIVPPGPASDASSRRPLSVSVRGLPPPNWAGAVVDPTTGLNVHAFVLAIEYSRGL